MWVGDGQEANKAVEASSQQTAQPEQQEQQAQEQEQQKQAESTLTNGLAPSSGGDGDSGLVKATTIVTPATSAAGDSTDQSAADNANSTSMDTS